SPVLSGGQHTPHKIQGIGAGFIPDILDRSVIDEIVKVNGPAAIEMSRALARMEGIPGGISSGAAIAAALEIGKRPDSAGKTILAIVPSFSERYLSTALFEGIYRWLTSRGGRDPWRMDEARPRRRSSVPPPRSWRHRRSRPGFPA